MLITDLGYIPLYNKTLLSFLVIVTCDMKSNWSLKGTIDILSIFAADYFDD